MCTRVVSMFALALTALSTMAFTPGTHRKITQQVNDSIFQCNDGCHEFLQQVHKLADDRIGGDKNNGRLFLHYIRPVCGYADEAHEAVLSGLGINDLRKATLGEFVELSTRRAIDFAAAQLKRSGDLSDDSVGGILYTLGVLVHATQDKKHLDGNWSDPGRRGITSIDHMTTEIHQMFSDIWPSKTIKNTAIKRTERFLSGYWRDIAKIAGSAATNTLRARISVFELLRGRHASDYRPAVLDMEWLFPEYKVNSLGNCR